MIIKDTGEYPEHPLFHQYENQLHPQEGIIGIDCRDGSLFADWDPEIGNAVPIDVWHGHIQWFEVTPYIRRDDLISLLEEVKPYAECIIAGYESQWDGNNHVAKFSEDAELAMQELDEYLVKYNAFAEPCSNDECPVCHPE
jgi:hypothetical protein